jgi:hypothetical protein
MNRMLPTVVAHADWSIGNSKRWVAVAQQSSGGTYVVGAPWRVDDAPGLVTQLADQASGRSGVLLGFDFPIGLPLGYAARAGVRRFRQLLPVLGSEEWQQFFRVAERASEVSHARPFYPQRSGSTKQAHLHDGLGVGSLDDLRRQCELAQPGRRAASPLFWTLGGQQVGKAAISGWQEVLVPALRAADPPVALWPFDGQLSEFVQQGRVVIAETYPAEYYRHLGVTFPASRAGERSGKRVQRDRAAAAPALLAWATETGVVLASDARTQILDGYGAGADGEDRFDATVGLFGMLDVVLGRRAAGEPQYARVREVEGWILGQEPASTGEAVALRR